MELKVSGNSGVTVSIIDNGMNDIFVRKSTDIREKVSRLELQATKQLHAKTNVSNIKIPKIYGITNNKDEYFKIDMEYVYSYNFVEFFENAYKDDINNFVSCIIDFIEEEISESEIVNVNKNDIILKIDSIVDKLELNSSVTKEYNKNIYKNILKIRDFVNMLPNEIQLPVGKCHGDLTYSNILFKGDNYYLIDWLDSYIESPIMDIVKIRQDSYFAWSNLMLEDKNFDNIRMSIINDYIDKKIDNHFKKYDWYNKYYQIFQMVNFLRILPYCRKESFNFMFISCCLKKLVDDYVF